MSASDQINLTKSNFAELLQLQLNTSNNTSKAPEQQAHEVTIRNTA